MMRARHIAALAAAVVPAVGGCRATVSPDEFIAKYTTNIEVLDPTDSTLPTRTFLGRGGKSKPYYAIKDVIPRGQGGGLFGKTITWRCPAADLPSNFPAAYRPGDVMLDGRDGAIHMYVIQTYVPPPPKPASTRPEGPQAATPP